MSQKPDPKDVYGVMRSVSARLSESVPLGSMPAKDDGDAAVARMLARIDDELDARSGGAGSSRRGSYWRSVSYTVPAKRQYVLGELLVPSDASFVETAYRTVLRRAPDPDGMTYFLEELRARRLTKVEILGALRWSEEGMAKQVHIDGLLIPFRLQKLKRKPIVGKLVSWAHALLRLGANHDRQQVLDTVQAQESHELGRHINLLVDEIAELRGQNAKLRQSIGELMPMMETAKVAERDEARIREKMDALYSAFEEQFRGSRELIRARIEPYLEWIREVGAGTLEAPVLDIGCGRGEWLELLGEHGLEASGIDLNHDFVASCKGTGLKVVEGDAVEVLRRMPEGSVGAITSMHLVEHLPFERVVELVEESLRVLRPGGLLFLETPNPENLLVGAHYFYMDPTHRNPLPSAMLQWLVGNRGFTDVRVERLSAHRELNAPPLIADDLPGAKSINDMLWLLNVGPDYAVLGRRP
ncbi:methyltransferase domain-containing protein [Lysobacter capsici]|uniref:methyltransferase domain-containing protein n=1 Tax=Lysobacter capsici TaxID=435897 RepID=UPI00177AAA5D|nr:methyltransferase domain-containing protein [Lysobacter capsici]UOF14017.1 methyltransferase domain-containing protein [Lysobacter capsici]